MCQNVCLDSLQHLPLRHVASPVNKHYTAAELR